MIFGIAVVLRCWTYPSDTIAGRVSLSLTNIARSPYLWFNVSLSQSFCQRIVLSSVAHYWNLLVLIRILYLNIVFLLLIAILFLILRAIMTTIGIHLRRRPWAILIWLFAAIFFSLKINLLFFLFLRAIIAYLLVNWFLLLFYVNSI